MAGAGERSLPHGHGGNEPRERDGKLGSSRSFSSQPQCLRLLKAPALTLAMARETGKRGQSRDTEVREGLGMGPGVCDPRPTAAEGGRGREEVGK